MYIFGPINKFCFQGEIDFQHGNSLHHQAMHPVVLEANDTVWQFNDGLPKKTM
jgi:hypothetical protein